jgi:hypothetical protein
MVKSDEAKSLAKRWNVPWIEISAKRKDMIENLFGNILIREIIKASESVPLERNGNSNSNDSKKCIIN